MRIVQSELLKKDVLKPNDYCKSFFHEQAVKDLENSIHVLKNEFKSSQERVNLLEHEISDSRAEFSTNTVIMFFFPFD